MSKRRRKAGAGEKDAGERWLITYADLVTLLFALFLVLFANSTLDEGKFERTAASFRRAFDLNILGGRAGGTGSVLDETGSDSLAPSFGEIQANDFQNISEELSKAALELGVYDQVQVRQTGDGIVVSLSDNLLFSPASAAIRDDAVPFLDRLAAIIADLPNEVRVEGHTDDVPVNAGAFATNWELSTARATAVLRHLVQSANVEPTRIHAAGYAEFQPVAGNDTVAGRAQNRRADVVILNPTSGARAEAPVFAVVAEE
ncbi:MAG: flagellar motor protein MotB [Dehalococcoidia bacterium]